jgi:(E)-4-hydroxy-3-methylbut-2-enyl-diphosphate synthase
MLTCATWDVPRVLAELRGLVEAGCEIVRLTVPTRRDLEALPEIRRRMVAERLRVPLVADIHFNPRLALDVVPHVEKVRINPGNFVDAKRFQVREYSDVQYADELRRVETALLPLIAALKRHGRSLRVGVNHGSLSDRVLNRYGDTPQGMVECAMEYLRVLAAHDYHEIILSMKSSNPLVVIAAYRLLVRQMEREGMDYPLHLGVTEAGNGPEGRIKSAIGIGALLCDGLGDTVRVSLTEPSAHEIPAARELVAAVEAIRQGPAWPEERLAPLPEIGRRSTRSVRLGEGQAALPGPGQDRHCLVWGRCDGPCPVRRRSGGHDG